MTVIALDYGRNLTLNFIHSLLKNSNEDPQKTKNYKFFGIYFFLFNEFAQRQLLQ